jgi:hypothetical protein
MNYKGEVPEIRGGLNWSMRRARWPRELAEKLNFFRELAIVDFRRCMVRRATAREKLTERTVAPKCTAKTNTVESVASSLCPERRA